MKKIVSKGKYQFFVKFKISKMTYNLQDRFSQNFNEIIERSYSNAYEFLPDN